MFLIHVQDVETGYYTLQAYSSLEEIADNFKRHGGPLAGPADKCEIHELEREDGKIYVTGIATLEPYYSLAARENRKSLPGYITSYPMGSDESRGFMLYSDDERIKQLFS